MKLLVTGACGFIGSNFVRYWLRTYPSDSIINLDKLTYAGHQSNLADFAEHSQYRFVHGDIADASLVSSLMADVDLVVNFAAETHVDRSIADSSQFIHSNVEGVRVLLDALKLRPQIRFHHVSTDEVYGSLAMTDQAFNESHPYDPNSPYSASKAGGDHLVRAYQHTYHLKTTISNCSNNYGPYQHPEKLIPLFITNLMQQRPIPVYGNGLNVRDWLHVEDHCRAIDLIIRQGRVGDTYCIGGNSELSNLDITKRLLALMGYGEEMISWVPDRLGHDLRYAIDYGKIQSELGWEPQHTFDEGLASTVAWYHDHQDWWRPLI